MTLSKIKTKSLITEHDLLYNWRLGLPIEVYCTNGHKTIAFGRINDIDECFIYINEIPYNRSSYLFFGCPSNHTTYGKY